VGSAPGFGAGNDAGAETSPGWTGQIGGAYVFQSSSGNEDSFLTQYNLNEGFVLEELELIYDGETAADRFYLEASGFGDASPSESARLGFRFHNGIGVFVDYDRRESFFRLAESDLSLRSDDWEIARWKGRLTIDSWKPLAAVVTLRRYDRTGTTLRPLYGLNELYSLGTTLDESMTEGAISLETRTLPVLIEFEQAWARYERSNRTFAADDSALVVDDPDLLDEATRLYDDTQDVPTSRLTVSYGNRRFEGLATVLYSDAELDSGGAGLTSFAVGGGPIGTIEFIDQVVGSASTETLFGAVNLGFKLSSSWTLRLAGESRDATTDAGLLGQRIVRAMSPLGGAIEISAPVDDNGVYDHTDSEVRLRVEFRRPQWSLWAGGFSAGRDVAWRRTVDDDLFEVDRTSDGFVAGGSWNPGKVVDLSLEYERGDFERYVFRTDPRTVDRIVLKFRSRIGEHWQLSAHARSESADNPSDVAGLDHRANPYGIAASWSGAGGKSAAGVDLERIDIETETGLVLPSGEPGLSRYDLDVASFSAWGDWRSRRVRLHGSGTYLDDRGDTWPLVSWNAMVRVTVQGSHGLEYGVFVEHWSYDDELADLDDFDVTRSGVTLL